MKKAVKTIKRVIVCNIHGKENITKKKGRKWLEEEVGLLSSIDKRRNFLFFKKWLEEEGGLLIAINRKWKI
jgi:hypothetical protein